MVNKKYDVVVVGEINPDLILAGDVLPEFGQVEKLVENAELTIGSSSAIFACGAAKLGLRTAFIGKIGKDIFGKFMIDSLEKCGIDTHGVVEDELHPTGISVILAKGSDRAILTNLGTIPRLKVNEIDPKIIRQAHHLHVGSYYLQEALQDGLETLLHTAKKTGLTTSFDTNYDPSRKWNGRVKEILDQVDVFLPNEYECKQVAGKSNLDQAIDYFIPRVKVLGVKRGIEGAMFCAGSLKLTTQALNIDVVDTVGAGDSFDAGFIYGFLMGWEPRKILSLATICGGLSTRKAGGTASQPTLEEALEYLYM